MNWLDIVILILLIIPTFVGLKAGLIKALLTIVGGVVGLILAGQFYEGFAGVLGFISNEGAAKVVAFAIIFVGIMIIAAILAAVLKKLVSMVMLGWVNKLGGAIFGFLIGAIFCGALLSMWVNFLGIGDTISDSALAGFLLNSFPLALALLPSEFDSVKSFFK
jgi:membrane protein required for colicin V production